MKLIEASFNNLKYFKSCSSELEFFKKYAAFSVRLVSSTDRVTEGIMSLSHCPVWFNSYSAPVERLCRRSMPVWHLLRYSNRSSISQKTRSAWRKAVSAKSSYDISIRYLVVIVRSPSQWVSRGLFFIVVISQLLLEIRRFENAAENGHFSYVNIFSFFFSIIARHGKERSNDGDFYLV